MKAQRKKKGFIVLSVLAAILIIVAVICFCYVNDYYHSDDTVQDYLQGDGQVRVEEIEDGLWLDGPGEESALIFYPGAKVEYTAYLPLLHRLAEEGLDCFLLRMPCNLAIFGQNKAEDVIGQYDYGRWYLAGHSLGGAMAASYASENMGKLEGLALLASYPAKSLVSASFSVVSIYGSEDGVLSMEKVEEGRSYMPEDYREVCIEGGNHAGFGDYGPQDGDGEALITREDQQGQTADLILQMVKKQREDGRVRTESEESETERSETMGYEQISAQEAKKIMDSNEKILILDVRTQEEYAGGHIRGALCLPNEEIAGEEPEMLPDKEQKLLVYCRSGRRSKEAAQKLADMGYEDVLEFGGILDWPYDEMVEK